MYIPVWLLLLGAASILLIGILVGININEEERKEDEDLNS
jgi:hypothetical protein